MKSIPSSRIDHQLKYIRGDAGPRYPDADFRLRGQVDDLCRALFDHWCERRELIPLAYLLHAWPFLPTTPYPVDALLTGLRHLLVFHGETIDDLGRQLIGDIQTLQGYEA